MLVCTMRTSNCSISATPFASRRSFGTKKSHIVFGTQAQFVWHQCLHNLPVVSFSSIPRNRNSRIEAGWLFQRGEKNSEAGTGLSDMVNEDIEFFCFKVEMIKSEQDALNTGQYELAKGLRNKITELEAEFIEKQNSKRGLDSKSEAQDKSISISRLSVELEDAVANENYSLAAELRDKISKLEADSLAAYENTEYMFRLGQKLKHKKFGYRAVVCGMDPVCCESKEWMETANVQSLARGSEQPFYQVLVDVTAEPEGTNVLVAYVPEENLVAPDQPDLNKFINPFTYFLFCGVDSAGDYIPVQQLREKYKQPRQEAPYDPKDEKSDTGA